ncbi:MAG: AI-2E family transporter [Propionibacteriaceae bacterium]|jgi:predicted PurR-regulated permease PerM|nr:AI-2E family transporter [Propionibacteriaceae bacterium]
MENEDLDATPSEQHAGNLLLPRYVVAVLGVAGTLIALVLLREFAGIFAPIFLALNLVIAAYPIYSWLHSKGVPAWIAACVMTLAMVVILLIAVAGLVWAVNSLIDELPEFTEEYYEVYYSALDLLRDFGIQTSGFTDIMSQANPSTIASVAASLLSQTWSVMGAMAIIVAALVFFAMDTPGWDERTRFAGRTSRHVSEVFASLGSGIRRYWLVSSLFGMIVAMLDGLALIALDVPLVLVWVMLSFLTNYIPNIGFVVGLIPPALLALFAHGWQTSLEVVIAYCVLNFVVQTIIQPRFTGDAVGVTASVSFISLLLWGWVFGAMGALLALPMTLLVKAVLVDIDPGAKWVEALISSNPGPDTKDQRRRAALERRRSRAKSRAAASASNG